MSNDICQACGGGPGSQYDCSCTGVNEEFSSNVVRTKATLIGATDGGIPVFKVDLSGKSRVIPCGKGFVGKKSGAGAPDYLDQGGEWLPSFNGPPETVCTKPFPTPEATQAGIAQELARRQVAEAAHQQQRATNLAVSDGVEKMMDEQGANSIRELRMTSLDLRRMILDSFYVLPEFVERGKP